MTEELETLQHFYEVVIDFLVTYSFQLVGGLLTGGCGTPVVAGGRAGIVSVQGCCRFWLQRARLVAGPSC